MKNQPKIITLAHSNKGGVGKTTVAWELAIHYSQKKEGKIYLVDLDFRATMTYNFARREERGLDISNITLLRTQNTRDLLSMIDKLKEDKENGVMIIDSGGYDLDINWVAAYCSDLLITPTPDRPNEQSALIEWDRLLEKMSQKIDRDLICYVLPNELYVGKKSMDYINGVINKSKHLRLLDSILRHRKIYYSAPGEGMNTSELKKSLKKKTSWLSNRLDLKSADRATREVNDLVTELDSLMRS